jgi:hypothetical protein
VSLRKIIVFIILYGLLTGDVPRVNGQLAVARAFGDQSLKAHLSSEPDIKHVPINSSIEFVILASDGLWKVSTKITPFFFHFLASEFWVSLGENVYVHIVLFNVYVPESAKNVLIWASFDWFLHHQIFLSSISKQQMLEMSPCLLKYSFTFCLAMWKIQNKLMGVS